MQPIIQIKNLTAGYGGKAVITDLSITIKNNEFIGVIGPNGSGKTTLLKAILGQEKPISGTVEFCGKPTIGYLPQYNASDKLFPISVKDTVLSGLNGELGLFGRVTDRHRARLAQTLERFKLTDLADRPLKALSGGQLQRVLLARAVISSPDILILDEPHTYIDEAFGVEMDRILREELEHSVIIMVSHEKEYVKKIATKIIHLDKKC